MKPRNKKEREVAELSKKLAPLAERQKRWAIEKVFPHVAWTTKSTAWCSECGEVFENDPSNKSAYIVCPHCGRRLKKETANRRKYEEKYYFTVILFFKGYQVFRHFIIEKRMRKDWQDKKPLYNAAEAVQLWIDRHGKMITIARPTIMSYYCYDRWNFNYPMSIKEHCSGFDAKYDVDAEIYPHYKIMPEAVKTGFSVAKAYEFGLTPSELMKHLLYNPNIEMLLKTGQISMLCDVIKNKRGMVPCVHAIRICNRNKYIVNDANLWFDYVGMLERLRIDTHNAYYVCPKNLKEAHDRIFRRFQRLREKERAKEKLEQAKTREADYAKAKGKYFGICFGNEEIVVTVLKSVREFFEEAEAMHHCVFEREYYDKEESLILSAKDKKGERLETIEVNLDTFKIVQSRGVCNENSDYHDEIVKLVNDNINLIKKVA